MQTLKTFSKSVLIILSFFGMYWFSVNLLTSEHAAAPVMQASIPSLGLINIAVFLFWFVVYLTPSWGDE